MAFPVVESLTPTAFDSAATAHLVAMPATVNAGDLLVVFFGNDGSQTVTNPSGWTELHSTDHPVTNQVRFGTYYKIAAGTEGGTTVDFVTSTSTKAVAHVYRISTWHGTTPPEIGTAATGASVNPNPPSLTPSWGAADTLWLIGVGEDAVQTTSAYSTSYTNGTTTSSAPTSANTVGSARRELNATSDNPSAWTISATNEWIAQTIAIRPVAGTAPTAPTDLTASPLSSSQIELNWTDNSTDEDGFIIERSLDGSTGWTQVGDEEPDFPVFTDFDLDANTEYFYRVKAYNSFGSSAYTSVASATTFDTATVTVSVGACSGGVADVTITITPDAGAIIEVEDESSTVHSGNSVVLEDLLAGDYSWSAVASFGYEIIGPSSGIFVVCPPSRLIPVLLISNDGWDTGPVPGQDVLAHVAGDDDDYITVTV